MHNLTRLFMVLALASFSLTPLHADGGAGGRDSPLAPFQKLIDDQISAGDHRAG
jgi:hypothetical protein